MLERKRVRVDELLADEEVDFRGHVHETGAAWPARDEVIDVAASAGDCRLGFRFQGFDGRRCGAASEKRGHGVSVTLSRRRFVDVSMRWRMAEYYNRG